MLHPQDCEKEDDDWIRIPLTAKISGLDQSNLNLCLSLRQLQHRRGCTNVLLEDMFEVMRPYLRCLSSVNFKSADKKMQEEAGVECIKLNGCVGCNAFIFLPNDRRHICPKCGVGRYFESGDAKEEVYYFPMMKRLQSLMKTKFAEKINHEIYRPRSSRYMCDVYDSPAWKEERGEIDYDLGEHVMYVFVCSNILFVIKLLCV